MRRRQSVEGLLDSCNGSTPACVVIAADRPDRSAMSAVRLIRSKLEEASAVLICRRARGTEVRRAVELGVGGVVLNGDCEEVLAQFAKAGIDIYALAVQLQDEGAKSFVKSWNELMGVIASKSAAIQELAGSVKAHS